MEGHNWEKRGGKVGLPRWLELGEIWKNFAVQHYLIFCNRESTDGWEPPRKRKELRVKGTGSKKFRPPVPSP